MMQINIPQAEQQRLAVLASAAGYDDVQGYVTEQVLALAHQTTPDESPELTPEQLAASLAQCDKAMAEAEAGKGRDFNQALDDIADRNGLNAT